MKTIASALVALSVVVGLVDPTGSATQPAASKISWVLFDAAERYDP